MKKINWMELSGLLVGVFTTVAIMIFALVFYAKIFSTGMIGVEEYKLHSTFDKPLGIRPGTRVQINGVDVGQISGMKLETNGVWMELTIRKEFQPWITDSAEVFAIRDQNLISARVINIDTKKGHGRILEDGDYLKPGKAQDIETVLETANELLGRVTELIDAADTLVSMAMDTGTTVGALFGSRLLYDNLNRQLSRIDDITLTGKRFLFKASDLLDTMQRQVPTLLTNVDNIATDVNSMLTELKPVPGHMENLLTSLDSTMGRVDGVVNTLGDVSQNLGDFINNTESTLQSAEDMINGVSNMWIFRRNIPSKDSVPFIVETLW